METIEKILNQILKSQEEMKSEMIDMKSEMTKMKSEMTDVKSEMTSVKSEVTSVKSEVTKLGLIQENMQRDIKLLAEGHQNILETMDRRFDEIRDEFGQRLDEVEAAVVNLGEDVKFIKHKEFQNEESIFKLRESLKIAK